MNIYVASRESPLTLASQQGLSCFNRTNKIIKKNSRSLRSLVFFFIIKLSSGHLISQFTKVILISWFYCYNF